MSGDALEEARTFTWLKMACERLVNAQNALTDADLAKAKVIDISHYGVTMASSAVYNSKGVKPKVKVSGLKVSNCTVTYYKNKKVGTAYARVGGKTYYGAWSKVRTTLK